MLLMLLDVKLEVMLFFSRDGHRSYTHCHRSEVKTRPRCKLVALIETLVITQSYMGKMRRVQRVSMDVNSVAVKLALLVRAGDGVQAVLGTKIGR
jgi:hypothetical protein